MWEEKFNVNEQHVENVDDRVNVNNDMNIDDDVNVDGGVNGLSSFSSGPLEPFISMPYDIIEMHIQDENFLPFGRTILNCQRMKITNFVQHIIFAHGKAFGEKN